MAEVHEAQGNVQEARLLFLESAAIYTQVYGADHEETLDAARRAATVGQVVVECDGCGAEVGASAWWHCTQCEDTDLCQSCHHAFLTEGRHHVTDHIFTQL